MNEVMVKGWFYMPTKATTNEEALEEFKKKCELVGIDADNIDLVIVRDEDGEDLTTMTLYL